MGVKRLGIVMNGVTGRMGTNQHLVRSIVAIRAEGGVALKNGDRVMPDPILVGRNEEKLAALAKAHGIARYTTNLDAALADKNDTVFFDAATTQMRPALARQGHRRRQAHLLREADRHQPRGGARHRAQGQGRRHQARRGAGQAVPARPAQAQDADRLRASSAGILSVRGEFGYWVFEGDLQPAQRPSWNYRAEDGGGIILDMLCHWRYVLDNTFGNVKSVSCLGATHIPERIDEDGKRYKATADDAAYATFQLDGGVIAHFNCSWATRVRRDDLLTLHVDGTHGSAVAGLQDVVTQQRMATPKPVWNPDVKQTDRLLRRLAAGAGDAGLRQRLQAAVGGLHPPRRRGRALQVGPHRRRQGRAARRMRAAELEGAPLGRRAGAEGLNCHPGRVASRLSGDPGP